MLYLFPIPVHLLQMTWNYYDQHTKETLVLGYECDIVPPLRLCQAFLISDRQGRVLG